MESLRSCETEEGLRRGNKDPEMRQEDIARYLELCQRVAGIGRSTEAILASESDLVTRKGFRFRKYEEPYNNNEYLPSDKCPL